MQTCLAIFGISRDSTCCEKSIDVKQFLLVQLYFFTHPTHSSTLFAQRPRISAVQDDAEQMVAELRQEPSSFGLWGETLLRSLESLRILGNPGESLGSSCNFDGRAMENVFSMVCIGLVSPGSLWLSERFFALTCFEFRNQMTSPNCSSMRRLPN